MTQIDLRNVTEISRNRKETRAQIVVITVDSRGRKRSVTRHVNIVGGKYEGRE